MTYPVTIVPQTTIPSSSIPAVLPQAVEFYPAPVSNLTWSSIKAAIAAGGRPTTPLGKFFDWLVGINAYPEEVIDPQYTVETSRTAEMRYIRYILTGGTATEYQQSLWAVSAIYDRSITGNEEMQTCVLNALDKINHNCQENLAPGIHDELILTYCTDGNPSFFIPTSCQVESSEVPMPLYTRITPSLYLNHTITLLTSVTNSNDGSEAPYGLVLPEANTIISTSLSNDCRARLEIALEEHLWCAIQPCLTEQSECSLRNPYTKEAPIVAGPDFAVFIPVEHKNETLSMYSVANSKYYDLISVSQWTIRVLTESPEFNPIQQCIINTLNNRAESCVFDNYYENQNTMAYQLWQYCSRGYLKNLEMDNALSFASNLSKGIVLEHQYNAAWGIPGVSPNLPLYWSHDKEFYNSCPAVIIDIFNTHLRCLIAHCYPPTPDTYALFRGCDVSMLPTRPPEAPVEDSPPISIPSDDTQKTTAKPLILIPIIVSLYLLARIAFVKWTEAQKTTSHKQVKDVV